MLNETANREAVGGSIHSTCEVIFEPGETVQLSPGFDYEWENGYKEGTKFFRRDGQELHPTRCSPLPGRTLHLK
jgi:hypothetical protein